MATQINASVIADSITNTGARLTTLELKYPRFILAQVNTHRAFSRNTSSSRAIPSAKLINQVRNDPAIPVKWGKNCAGMQSWEELVQVAESLAKAAWLEGADRAADVAECLVDLGCHKQIVNRVLEPYLWTKQIVSSTEWDNFFTLRLDDAAQPEMQVLAQEMKRAIDGSVPMCLDRGDWHTPYAGGGLTCGDGEGDFDNLKISVARCARVSYFDLDGGLDLDKFLALYEKLRSSGHWSPFEHVATPDASYFPPKAQGNFRGWAQLRHLAEYQ